MEEVAEEVDDAEGADPDAEVGDARAGSGAPAATATVVPRRRPRPGRRLLSSGTTGSTRCAANRSSFPVGRTSSARAAAPLIMRPAIATRLVLLVLDLTRRPREGGFLRSGAVLPSRRPEADDLFAGRKDAGQEVGVRHGLVMWSLPSPHQGRPETGDRMTRAGKGGGARRGAGNAGAGSGSRGRRRARAEGAGGSGRSRRCGTGRCGERRRGRGE